MSSVDRTRIVQNAHRAMTVVALIAGLLAALVTVACGGGSTSTNGGGEGPVAASVQATVSAGTAPVSVALDSAVNKIYVANLGTAQTISGRCQSTGSDITVIDGATDVASTLTPSDPSWNTEAVAVNSANHAVYAVIDKYFLNLGNCAFSNAGLVSVNGPSTSADFCAVCRFGGITINEQTNTIYLGNYYYNFIDQLLNSYVSVFNSTSTWNTQVDVSLMPFVSGPMAANSATNKVYVAAGGLSVIDGVTNSLTPFVGNVGVAAIDVNPNTNELYVADGSSKVTVIDGATGSITATIEVGTSPVAVAVDSQTNFIYVANAGNSQSGDLGNVTVINGATHATQTLTDANAKKPSAVAVNSTTNKIYVANSGSNNVTVIDGAHD